MSKNTPVAPAVKTALYTTTTGQTVELMPLPPLQIQMVQQAASREADEKFGPVPPKPTYTLTTADGAEETHEHDETTVAADPEAKKLWDEWQRLGQTHEAFTNEKVMRFFLLRGVKVDLPEGGEWEQMQKYFGLSVPEDPIERKLHYIQTELLGSLDDITGMMTSIMELSGVAPEVVEAAKETFRGAVGDTEGEPAA